jgi:hypothetical protein
VASVRAQIFAAVEAKLADVLATLAWTTLLVNPRDPVGEDQLDAIVLMHGGEPEPDGLTGRVDRRTLEFSVAWLVRERGGSTAEELLDAGFVAISDALLDPADIQLSNLAVAIAQGGVSDPAIGRAEKGARILGGQTMDFTVEYYAREGDASTAGP